VLSENVGWTALTWIFCRRLKDNFSIIKEEDRSRLLEAKDKVEKEFNEMKWTLIAETIKKEGGDLYTVSCIPHPSYSLVSPRGFANSLFSPTTCSVSTRSSWWRRDFVRRRVL
jgi:hypothetical protein